jgi:hypothetical protein
MKKIIFLLLATVCILNAKAQYKFPAVDASVMDMAVYPLNAIHDAKPVQIKVTYSRPLKKGREIFGGAGTLQPYGQAWRVGANEETEIRFYSPVNIGGKQLAAGTYSLFAIPEKDNWTIIINGTTDKWGLFYDRDKYQEKDIVRFQVPVKPLDNVVEALAITFTPLPNGNGNGANMVIGWDKTAVEVPILIAPTY